MLHDTARPSAERFSDIYYSFRELEPDEFVKVALKYAGIAIVDHWAMARLLSLSARFELDSEQHEAWMTAMMELGLEDQVEGFSRNILIKD